MKRLPGPLDLLAATAGIAFAMSLVYHAFPNPDLYWLLATGRRMVETHAFIYADPFTFTVPGSPWSPQSWLAALVYYGLFQAGGALALTVVRVILVAGVVALTLRSLRSIGASWAIASPLLIVALLVAHTRLTDRGQLFEYAFLAWLVGFLLRSHEVRGRAFFVVPIVVQVLWVQFHPSFLLGPALAALFFASEWIAPHVPGLRPLHTRDFRRAFALVAALAIACLVNPNPHAFLVQPFDPEQRALISRFTLEWKSPFDPAIASGNFHPYYEILLAVAALAILANFGRLPLAPTVLIAAVAVLSLQSHRFRVEFALVSVPMIALLALRAPAVEALARRLSARKRVPRASLLAGACGLALSLGLIVAERGRISAPLSAPHGRPARATAFVLEHDIAERPFHTIAFGSYFMWDAYGRRKTFIDGRNVSAEVYRDFLFAQASDDGWRAAIRKYRIDSFILPPLAVSDDGIRGIHERLARDATAWPLVHIDEDAYVYVSHAAVDSAWLDVYAFRAYRPTTFTEQALEPDRLRDAAAELDRATAESPNVAELWLHLGIARAALGETQPAIAALTRATAADPGLVSAWDELARVAITAGRLDEAQVAAAAVVRLLPQEAGAWVNFARVCEAKGDIAKAIAACERALALEPGNADALETRSRLRARGGAG